MSIKKVLFISIEVLAEMPARPNLRKQISRARLRQMPPNPTRISDLQEIPDEYTQTLGGSKFLLYDSYYDEEDEDEDCGRILIFSSSENLVQLFRCNVWFVDGTFKTAPSVFFQLFSILGAVTQVGINRKPQTIGLPFVHALLENKRQSAYTKVFNIILQEGKKLRLLNSQIPKYIMSDFELAIINAAQEIFSDELDEENVKCCLFHLCQNVFRRIQAEGLQELYNSADRRFKKASHALCALAFVPTGEVVQHFTDIRDYLPEELDPVTDYFEATYIRRMKAKRGRGSSSGFRWRFQFCQPTYPPSLWNQYKSVLEGAARTNNLSEGWHNRFQLVVAKHHPSLYVFFDELRKEQADTEIMLLQLQLGQRIRKGLDRRRREIEENILNVVQQYEEYKQRGDIITYLKTIGHHIKF